jgi:hypothetical protein
MTGVYFLQAGYGEGPIKIGMSGDVDRRVRTIQGMHYEDLALLGVIECDDVDQAYRVECQLHLRFAGTRIRGEWYRPCLELYQAIEARCGSYCHMIRSAEETFSARLEAGPLQ